MTKPSVLFYLLLLLSVNCFAQQESRLAVGQRTLLYEDGARARPLDTEVWYPTPDEQQQEPVNTSPFVRAATVPDGAVASGKHPLILLSHAFGTDRFSLEWFAAALAEKGFIVASLDHWGNTYHNLIVDETVKFLDRPKDVSFVLSRLLADTVFGKAIDENRIGAAGFSLGGFTAIALAGGQFDYHTYMEALQNGSNIALEVPGFPTLREILSTAQAREYFASTSPDVKDKRIKAVFAMAPALGEGFTSEAQLEQVDVPVLLVVGEADDVAPYKTNAQHFHKLMPGSEMKLLPGKVGHHVFLREAKEPLRKLLPMLYKDDPSVNRKSIHGQVAALAAEFFSKNL